MAGRGASAMSDGRPSELDELTLARARRGEPAACQRLVETYQGPVFGLIGRMLLSQGKQALVEDLAQETFLRAFRALDRFDPAGPARLGTWILTIAARLAVNELERRPVVLLGDAAVELAGGESPERALERRRLGAAITRAVAALEPPYRAAFLLRELSGLEYEDIARALAIDLGTVKSRLSRARAALRAALEEVSDG
jgi:RNA polymerase sigma-70 factor (ECF subfamily)